MEIDTLLAYFGISFWWLIYQSESVFLRIIHIKCLPHIYATVHVHTTVIGADLTIYENEAMECVSSEVISVKFHFILMRTYYHYNERFRAPQDSLDVITLYPLSREALMPTNENLWHNVLHTVNLWWPTWSIAVFLFAEITFIYHLSVSIRTTIWSD